MSFPDAHGPTPGTPNPAASNPAASNPAAQYGGAPHGGPAQWTPPVMPPRKRRPSAWWFLAPGLMILTAVAVAVAYVFFLVSQMNAVTAEFAANGEPHAVTLKNTGPHVLWIPVKTDGTCTVTDVATDTELPVRDYVEEDFSRTTRGPFEESARYEFTPRSTEISIQCTSHWNDTPQWLWAVSPTPNLIGIGVGLIATFAAGVLIGGGGLVWGIILIVLMATRTPRKA